MNENEIGGIVVDCAVKVHIMRLGPSLQESVYEALLFYDSGEALMKDGISRIINGNWKDQFILLRVSASPCEAILLC